MITPHAVLARQAGLATVAGRARYKLEEGDLANEANRWWSRERCCSSVGAVMAQQDVVKQTQTDDEGAMARALAAC